MIRPGPNNVPAVRERLRNGSGMRRCGRDSVYEGSARRESAIGCVRICWSIEDVNGSEDVYICSVSASSMVRADMSATKGEMVGWMARKKPVEVKIRARPESLRMRMVMRERGGGGGGGGGG